MSESGSVSGQGQGQHLRELHDEVDLLLALVLLAQLDDVRVAAGAEHDDLVLQHVLLVLQLRLVDHLDRVLVPAELAPAFIITYSLSQN